MCCCRDGVALDLPGRGSGLCAAGGGWWVGGQAASEVQSIRDVNKDRLAPVASRSGVVDRTGGFDSHWTGPEGRLRGVEAQGKT